MPHSTQFWLQLPFVEGGSLPECFRQAGGLHLPPTPEMIFFVNLFHICFLQKQYLPA
jgi:hypothetical protein